MKRMCRDNPSLISALAPTLGGTGEKRNTRYEQSEIGIIYDDEKAIVSEYRILTIQYNQCPKYDCC